MHNVISTSHTSWALFIAAVRNVPPMEVQSAINDENHLHKLKNATARQSMLQSPTAAIHQSLNHTHISTPQPSSPMPQHTAPAQPDVFTGGTTAPGMSLLICCCSLLRYHLWTTCSYPTSSMVVPISQRSMKRENSTGCQT
jgi:hypothetical protein